MYESILIISVIIISILFAAWVYSEKKLDGKFSKTISTVSFPFPLLALYAVFKLNISFGYILVGLTLGFTCNLDHLSKNRFSEFAKRGKIFFPNPPWHNYF